MCVCTCRSYKILLIGESSVGKTTLATRLCEDRFMTETRQHTLGEEIDERRRREGREGEREREKERERERERERESLLELF